jgi:hypothetical protein
VRFGKTFRPGKEGGCSPAFACGKRALRTGRPVPFKRAVCHDATDGLLTPFDRQRRRCSPAFACGKRALRTGLPVPFKRAVCHDTTDGLLTSSITGLFRLSERADASTSKELYLSGSAAEKEDTVRLTFARSKEPSGPVARFHSSELLPHVY